MLFGTAAGVITGVLFGQFVTIGRILTPILSADQWDTTADAGARLCFMVWPWADFKGIFSGPHGVLLRFFRHL